MEAVAAELGRVEIEGIFRWVKHANTHGNVGPHQG